MRPDRTAAVHGFWPLAMVTAIVITLISLGLWQLERLQWKLQLIDRIAARIAEPEMELPSRNLGGSDLEYRKVWIVGSFPNGPEARLFVMNEQGLPGYHIYSRFLLKDGRELVVNRGWLPKDVGDKNSNEFRARGGEIVLTGRLRLNRKKGPFTPDNDPRKNIWYFADLEALAAYLSIPEPLPIFLELDDDGSGVWPQGGVTRLAFANNHLQYAVTWFALAGLAIFMFGLWWIRGRKDKD